MEIVNIGSAANDGTGDTIRVAFSKVNDNFQFVTPEQYGAVGDGSTNDQAAIQDAVDSGNPVFFGKKNYRVNSTVTIPSNAMLFGCGVGSIISTTSNISIFTIQGKNAQIQNLAFVGNDTGAAQTGINVTGNAGLTLDYTSNQLTNCYFKDLTRGIYVTLVVGTTGSQHQGAIYAVNCYAESCGTGYYLDNRAEYCSFSNCVAYACTTGVLIVAGNVGWYGGHIVDGTTGITFSSGSNDGKCVIAGTRINHCSTAVTSGAVTLGSKFIGCEMIANGSITLSNTTTHEFMDCTIGNATLTLTNSTGVKFFNCRFNTTPTFSFTNGSPRFFNCVFDSGVVAGVSNTLEGGMVFNTTITPTQLSANTDNYAPTGGSSAYLIRIDASTPINLTGLSLSQVDGRQILLTNIGANTITLMNDVTSTAANRFLLGADFSLTAGLSVKLFYDGTSSRWRKI